VYEGIAGLYDPTCNEVYNLEVILTGRDFDTKDVKDPLTMMPGNLVFIAGLVDIDYENLTATAYAGVGDLHVGARVIPLPTALRPHEYIGN
jgi:hypothetical protein